MRIAALGDAHLGRSALSAVTPEGVNQREFDFEQSFASAVDRCLATNPDLIVWLGDVFDHPRPSYRSFRVAMRALAKIRDHGIGLVAISGNHDTPRLPGTGNPYAVLDDAFPDFHFAYRMAYEMVELPGLAIHCVPQTRTAEDAVAALQTAADSRQVDRVNLLITHPLVQSVERKYADINEIEIDEKELRADHVLLGHYHVFTQVRPTIHYAGSTDTFSFGDVDPKPKGIVVLDTDSGVCQLEGLTDQRTLHTPDPVYALGLGAGEVQTQIIERLSVLPAGSIARVALDGIAPEAHRLLDLRSIGEAAAHLLHWRLDPQFGDTKVDVEDLPELSSLVERWRGYASAQMVDLNEVDTDRVVEIGQRYLSEAIETSVDLGAD
jgi:DNA repair exonuclease SbcCD nuclease subunit